LTGAPKSYAVKKRKNFSPLRKIKAKSDFSFQIMEDSAHATPQAGARALPKPS